MFSVQDGFDIVIGNPPYIRLQKDGGKLGRLYQDAGFTTFARTGDIYQLFYEKGSKLLSRSGVLSYISSNSWLRADYGKSTRHYFTEQHSPLRLLEMGKDIFENAIVDTNILILREGKGDGRAKAVDMDRIANGSFPPPEHFWGEFQPRNEKPWSVLSTEELPILQKMETHGLPLVCWDIKINSGIKTGLNRAFVIDGTTRSQLIDIDPKSNEIIRRVLRGQDIQRFRAEWTDTWLIDTHNGHGRITAVNVMDYPAIKLHLDDFYTSLEKRNDQGRTPYNLRHCAYHEEFNEDKLLWIDLSDQGRFAFEDKGTYCVNSSMFLTGHSLRYLCAVLNAKLITWHMNNTASQSGMGTTRWIPINVGMIPVPRISDASQAPLIDLVNQILKAKDTAPDTDTCDLEAEIDKLVYQLYDLTDEEIAVIERQSQSG